MVLEKENWQNLPPDTIKVISFAGLVGDGAPLIVSSDSNSANGRLLHSNRSTESVDGVSKKSGFSHWLKSGNLFLQKLNFTPNEYHDSTFPNRAENSGELGRKIIEHDDNFSPKHSNPNHINGANSSVSEDENEDLLADFIDEDSQLPSRISTSSIPRNHSPQWNNEEIIAQTGSSICVLR